MSTDDLTRSVASSSELARLPLAAGQHLGAYRVIRLLGRGGMGEVYEAEDRDTGRRVAIKVPNHALASTIDRGRFLREGQLAASINHPNSVYIFGSEDINGTLAIVMELATGGTLKDAVRAGGPMPSPKAVDAILQVIDGLEAAAAAGVLHRDVKPANCFVDGDGNVKIGDFGLSINPEAHEQTHVSLTAGIVGTPAFAPPEQLRGHPLDVRCDVYSTGATLYYLLTGRAPFDGHSIMELVAKVLEGGAEPPNRLAPNVPEGLAQILERCLAKDPSARPQSYQQFRHQLMAFSSQAPAIAGPYSRVVAAIIDTLIVMTPVSIIGLSNTRVDLFLSRPMAADICLFFFYFIVLEGLWGASLGKRLMGIRVTDVNNQPAYLGPVCVRALLYTSVPALPAFVLVSTRILDFQMLAPLVEGTIYLIGWLILFSTARPKNRFSGLHDLASGTRVVHRLETFAREPLSVPHGVHEMSGAAPRIGPYVVAGTGSAQDGHSVVLAYDEVLRRRVWIDVKPAGSPAVLPSRRDLARPGRLRWLTGRRTPSEAWDAYDAPEGLAFRAIPPDRRSWSAFRFWLFDLVRELDAVVGEQSDAVLNIDHVWITQTGRAMLLDFRCPGVPAQTPAPSRQTAGQADAFIRTFAASASTGDASTLPAHAHALLHKIERRLFPGLTAMAAALHSVLGKQVVLTRQRRAVHIALCAATPAGALLVGLWSAAVRGSFSEAALIAPLAASMIWMTSIAVWSAALFRGGLMLQALGIAVITGAGEQASRERAFLRAVVAWAPCLGFLFAVLFDATWLALAALAMAICGAVTACVTPTRGFQDRILGTWLVAK